MIFTFLIVFLVLLGMSHRHSRPFGYPYTWVRTFGFQNRMCPEEVSSFGVYECEAKRKGCDRFISPR